MFLICFFSSESLTFARECLNIIGSGVRRCVKNTVGGSYPWRQAGECQCVSVGELAEREKADRLNHEWEDNGGIGLGGKRGFV